MNARIRWIDIAKFLAIFTVLVEHTQYLMVCDQTFYALRVFMVSYFLQVFFLTHGYIERERIQEYNICQLIIKRSKQLIIPYFLWALVLSYGNYNKIFWKNILYGTNNSISNVSNGVLWFLPVMFIASIIFSILLKIGKMVKYANVVYCIGLFVCLCLGECLGKNIKEYPWGVDIALVAVAFMIIGYCLNGVIKRMEKWKILFKVICISIFMVSAYIWQSYNINIGVDQYGNIAWQNQIWMARGIYGKNIIIFVISSVFASLSIFLLAQILEKVRILAYLGENSILLMMLHIIIHPISVEIINVFISKPTFIKSILVASISILIAVPIMIFINRNMPIFGGKSLAMKSL